MAGAVRLGDSCSGHGGFGSRASTSGSPNVFINGKQAVREGDSWATHCNSLPSCHSGTSAEGSPTVFVNGKPKMRVGDAVSCGSTASQGSSNVFVN